MKEFIVTTITALETPYTVTDKATGQTFPMVTLELQLMSPPNVMQTARLHFPPALLRDAIPRLQGTIQMALERSKGPGTTH